MRYHHPGRLIVPWYESREGLRIVAIRKHYELALVLVRIAQADLVAGRAVYRDHEIRSLHDLALDRYGSPARIFVILKFEVLQIEAEPLVPEIADQHERRELPFKGSSRNQG